MSKFTLRQVLESLEGPWATYFEDFARLPAEKQQAFLQQQGFARFRDLAAHVVAWWEEGHRVIVGILDNPDFKDITRDVDAFNMEAVQRFGKMSDDAFQEYYHQMRGVLMELVKELPDDALQNADIAAWLEADVLEHYHEHNPQAE